MQHRPASLNALPSLLRTFCTTKKEEMELSERAKYYLLKIKKDFNWSADKDETKRYLEKQNFIPTEEILKFQANYSGLELKTNGNKRDKFSAYLFSKSQIANNEPLEIEKVNEKFIFICGDHETAQFRFWLTDKGEICTVDDDDTLNILYSSFDKKIEEYALKNEIQNWKQNPYYFEIQSQKELTSLMNSEFEIISECSDNYATWWKNENLIIANGVWLDRPERYFHVYGKEEKMCNQLVERLQKTNILK
jgi:hypothetical protein